MKLPAAIWVGYCLMAVSLAAAVLFTGGVYPDSWEWSALAASLGSILCVLAGPKVPKARGGFILLALLLGWMVLSLAPLPPVLVEHVFPARWSAVAAARQITGQNTGGWLALSLAPAATLERLLDVVPALAVFVAVREMGWWWRDRVWIAAAPVMIVAWCESVLGLVQFGMMRAAGGDVASATGTYVNRNHFAGLLEMAFPLAVAGAFAAWRKGAALRKGAASRSAVLLSALLLGAAGCLLAGVVVSLSRMGFVATALTALVIMPMLVVAGSSRLRWLVPLAALLCILLLLPTKELKQRFAYTAANEEVNTDTRVAIWRDTLQLVSAHKWSGTGLGTYERGLYAYKTTKPTNTLDFAHNDYLQILAELGIAGWLPAAALAVWILWRPVRIALWHRSAGNYELAVGLLGALLALGLHSLTDFNLYIPANALALAWLAGLAVSPGLLED